VNRAQPGDAVAVAGRVAATDGVLRAPCSGRPCVYYEVVLEQYWASEGSYQWLQLLTVKRGIDFALEEGGVSCHVSQQPGLRAAHRHDYFVGAWQRGADGKEAEGVLPEPLVELCKEWFKEVRGCCKSNESLFYPNSGVRMSEKAYVVGQPLTCLGRLERQGSKLVLAPAAGAAVDKKGWTSNEKRSWSALVAPKKARVLASDQPKHLPPALGVPEAPLPEAIGERGRGPSANPVTAEGLAYAMAHS